MIGWMPQETLGEVMEMFFSGGWKHSVYWFGDDMSIYTCVKDH